MPQLKPVAVEQWVRHHPRVMVMQPVLEIFAADDFTLWPVGEHKSYGYLVLNGELTPVEVGTAVMRIADYNGFEPEEEHGPCPTDPLGTFLHGLLTMPDLLAAGGFRVTDNATGTVFVEPGCCSGLETWRDWLEVLDGTGCSYFGHNPSSMAERVGDSGGPAVSAGHPVRLLQRHSLATAAAGAGVRLRADLLAAPGTVAAGRCLRPAAPYPARRVERSRRTRLVARVDGSHIRAKRGEPTPVRRRSTHHINPS